MRSLPIILIIAFVIACSSSWSATDGGADAATAMDPTFAFDANTNDASDPGTQCSSDLHHVLDAQGVVVETCAPDQGCAAGKCVDACIAAGASKGSLGCDYVVATPSVYAAIRPPCFAMFVANAWGVDAPLKVERAGQSYDLGKFARIAEAGKPETSWAPVPPSGIPARESRGALLVA